MIELLERFVAAMEKIAAAMSEPGPLNINLGGVPEHKPCGGYKVEKKDIDDIIPEDIRPGEWTQVDKLPTGDEVYDGPPPQPSYDDQTIDALKMLCNERGINIPKGTRKNTIIKKLEVWDAEPPKVIETFPNEDTNGDIPAKLETEDDPIHDDGGDADEDPFAVTEPAGDDGEFTEQDMRAALQAYAAKHDAIKAFNILRDNADGAKKVKETDPKYYGAVVKACREGM